MGRQGVALKRCIPFISAISAQCLEEIAQNSNKYLRIWMAKHRWEYLDVLYAREAWDESAMCWCGSPGLWHCLECLGSPVLCTGCCEQSHWYSPFHRIEKWTRTHFALAWLREVGVQVHHGHAGLVCTHRVVLAAKATQPSSLFSRMSRASAGNADENVIAEATRASVSHALFDQMPLLSQR